MKNLFILLAVVMSLQLNAQKFSVGARASVAIPLGKLASNDITDPEALFIGTGVGYNVNLAYSFNNFIGVKLKFGQNENRVQIEDYSNKLSYNNFSYYTVESPTNYSLKHISIGPKFNLPLNQKLSFQLIPSIGYCSGIRADYIFKGFPSTNIHKIHSAKSNFIFCEFESALLFNPSELISISLGINLQYSLLLYDKVPITTQSSSSTYQTTDSFLDHYWMFSPQLGLNYNF